jgi:hypothetical protein
MKTKTVGAILTLLAGFVVFCFVYPTWHSQGRIRVARDHADIAAASETPEMGYDPYCVRANFSKLPPLVIATNSPAGRR